MAKPQLHSCQLMARALSIFLGTLLSLGFPLSAECKTWYVSLQPSPPKRGERPAKGEAWSNPYKGFSEIDWKKVNSGDTIMVDGNKTGNVMLYNEPLTIRKSGITVTTSAEADHAGFAVISGTGRHGTGIEFLSNQNVQIIGRAMPPKEGEPQNSIIVTRWDSWGVNIGPAAGGTILRHVNLYNNSGPGGAGARIAAQKVSFANVNLMNSRLDLAVPDQPGPTFTNCWFSAGPYALYAVDGIHVLNALGSTVLFNFQSCIFGPCFRRALVFERENGTLKLEDCLFINSLNVNIEKGKGDHTTMTFDFDRITSFLTSLNFYHKGHTNMNFTVGGDSVR
ncbi:MAG: hypothetical protein K2X97_15730, partial [Mycobacteriaceae bacterium]|nr:hypothetical protein [Mycobacteriaceae bacterium]